MNLSNKTCSVKGCNKVAFYYVSDRKLFFCDTHKDLAYNKQKNDTYDRDHDRGLKEELFKSK